MNKTQLNEIRNRYRKTIYFGKELYEQLQQVSKALGIPFSTCVRVILTTGLDVANAIERSFKDE